MIMLHSNDMVEHEHGEVPEDREHYPYVTRSLIRLYGDGLLTNVEDIFF